MRDAKLPELPAPRLCPYHEYYTAEQMHDYAHAAIATPPSAQAAGGADMTVLQAYAQGVNDACAGKVPWHQPEGDAVADDGYPAPLVSVDDICQLQTLARNLGYMIKKRWPAKDHDVSDEWVGANIGHASAAAKHALPALNRVTGALADAAWVAGQRSKDAAIRNDEQAAQVEAVYAVPTDDETWQHFDSPPPMCDYEVLYRTPTQQPSTGEA